MFKAVCRLLYCVLSAAAVVALGVVGAACIILMMFTLHSGRKAISARQT